MSVEEYVRLTWSPYSDILRERGVLESDIEALHEQIAQRLVDSRKRPEEVSAKHVVKRQVPILDNSLQSRRSPTEGAAHNESSGTEKGSTQRFRFDGAEQKGRKTAGGNSTPRSNGTHQRESRQTLRPRICSDSNKPPKGSLTQLESRGKCCSSDAESSDSKNTRHGKVRVSKNLQRSQYDGNDRPSRRTYFDDLARPRDTLDRKTNQKRRGYTYSLRRREKPNKLHDSDSAESYMEKRLDRKERKLRGWSSSSFSYSSSFSHSSSTEADRRGRRPVRHSHRSASGAGRHRHVSSSGSRYGSHHQDRTLREPNEARSPAWSGCSATRRAAEPIKTVDVLPPNGPLRVPRSDRLPIYASRDGLLNRPRKVVSAETCGTELIRSDYHSSARSSFIRGASSADEGVVPRGLRKAGEPEDFQPPEAPAPQNIAYKAASQNRQPSARTSAQGSFTVSGATLVQPANVVVPYPSSARGSSQQLVRSTAGPSLGTTRSQRASALSGSDKLSSTPSGIICMVCGAPLGECTCKEHVAKGQISANSDWAAHTYI